MTKTYTKYIKICKSIKKYIYIAYIYIIAFGFLGLSFSTGPNTASPFTSTVPVERLATKAAGLHADLQLRGLILPSVRAPGVAPGARWGIVARMMIATLMMFVTVCC